MNTCEILTAARALISDYDNWTQGAFARKSDGNACSILHPDATSFCATGAINRILRFPAESLTEWPAAPHLLNPASLTLFGEFVEEVNDYYDHTAVLQVFDYAILNACIQEDTQ